MSTGNWNLEGQAQYWSQRQQLRTKTQQIDTALAEARVALLDGRIPAAKRLYLESYDVEQEAQGLAQQLNVPGPAGQVATAFDLAMREKSDAIVQGDLVDAAAIRMQFQGMAEIEQALTGGTQALALLPRALLEKSQQAVNGKQFDRAEEYLEQQLDLDPANVEAQIQLADVLLDRARESAPDGAAALLLVNRARAIYERVKDTPEFAARRGRFEIVLAERQAAAHFAAGERARHGWRLLSARANFRLVPDTSPHGPQARERERAVAFQLGAGALIGLGVLAALLFVLVPALSANSPQRPTATAAAASSTGSSSASATRVITTAAPATAISTTSVSATTAPAATTVPDPTTPAAPTAIPVQPNMVLRGQIVRDGVAVYKRAERRKEEAILVLARNSDWFICETDNVHDSYLISSDPCNADDKPLGWVNQDYVKPRIETATPET